MKNILLSLLLTVASLLSFSQEGFEGEVTYKISYKNLPDSMGMYKAMLPKRTKLVIKNEWSKIEQNMIVAKIEVISNSKTKQNIMLMKGMGKKIAVKSMDTTAKDASQFTISRMKDLKVIAGYKCTKVVMKDTGDNTITLWVTKELPAYQNTNLPDMDMGGFPMEFSFEQNGMRMRMTASKVNRKEIDDSEFQIPEGYEIKTAEEMGEMMQGMDFGGK